MLIGLEETFPRTLHRLTSQTRALPTMNRSQMPRYHRSGKHPDAGRPATALNFGALHFIHDGITPTVNYHPYEEPNLSVISPVSLLR